MTEPVDQADGDVATEARDEVARQLADLQKLHLRLAAEAHSLKRLGNSGSAMMEIRLAYEMLEQYLAQSDAFMENMRGRFEARLNVLRRAEPQADGRPNQIDLAPGHTEFWLEFSRLTAVLRRIARRAEM